MKIYSNKNCKFCLTHIDDKYIKNNIKLIINFYKKNDQNLNLHNFEYKLKKSIVSGAMALNLNGIIVAIYLSKEQKLLDMSNIYAVQSMDTMVDINYRGYGLMNKLAELHYEKLKNDGCKIIFGLPNKNSSSNFYNKLGWEKYTKTYLFIIPIPNLVLKIYGFFYKLLFNNCECKYMYNLNITDITHFDFKANNKTLSVIKDYKYYSAIGLIRSKKNINLFKKLYIISTISNSLTTIFFKTYATKNSETGKFISNIALKKESLIFSGKLFDDSINEKIKKCKFEYIEYDTFGM